MNGRIRAILIAVSGIALSITAPAAAAVNDCGNYYTDYVYYSDASLSEAIGGLIIDCDGTRMPYGKRSIYMTQTSFPCNNCPID